MPVVVRDNAGGVTDNPHHAGFLTTIALNGFLVLTGTRGLPRSERFLAPYASVSGVRLNG